VNGKHIVPGAIFFPYNRLQLAGGVLLRVA
jgi:hypothetical protein